MRNQKFNQMFYMFVLSLIRLKHFSSYQNVVGREIFKVKGGDVISSVGFDLFHLSFVGISSKSISIFQTRSNLLKILLD